MRLGPLSGMELGVLLVGALPWLIPVVVASIALGLLRRSARAKERMADAVERERR